MAIGGKAGSWHRPLSSTALLFPASSTPRWHLQGLVPMRHCLLLRILAAMPLVSHAIEEPGYKVIKTFDKVELRQHAPYVVAEVVLAASAEDAGSQAFPILAGYIFGKNKGEKKLAMTAPVTQTAAPMRMDMTAPVTQDAVAGGVRACSLCCPKA
jgi:hypothetical protein